jgi:predicted RNA binding protein YcfA (HicA-like mRNA interferase family)
MSRNLPSLTSSELIKALGKAGWQPDRQTGSHIILVKDGAERPIPVPGHHKTLKNTLRDAIIKQAGLTREDFIKLL